MTNYVPSIPDCDRWKKYISNLAKGRTNSNLDSYITSDSPLADIKVVSPAEGDLAIVKSRARQYKKKAKQTQAHTSSSLVRIKRSAKVVKAATVPKAKRKRGNSKSSAGKRGEAKSARSSTGKRGRPKTKAKGGRPKTR
jgi:hypothetical protein